MRPGRLTPARIEFVDGVPRAPEFDDLYHPRAGAQGQARHVFLGGNHLPARWRGRRRFAILETGFGLGHNALATWAAWREDPQRCAHLDLVSVELHPPAREDLARALAASDAPAALAGALVAAWPPPTPGLHRLAFDGGRFVLWLALGDAQRVLPSLVGRFDAFYLDGFAPDRNPGLWDQRLLGTLGRLAAPSATAATWSVARAVREGLAHAGFDIRRQPGFGGKREMLAGRFAPRFVPSPWPGRPPAREEDVNGWPAAAMATASPGTQVGTGTTRERHAVIVGAGIAGATVARALARRGWRCTVLDRAVTPASGASGNPAGLFHGTLDAEEGVHARLLRAGTLMAAPLYAELVAGGVPGAVAGLLACREGRDTAAPTAAALVADYARVLGAREAAALAGVALPGPATCFMQAGWVDPGAVVRACLAEPQVDFVGEIDVAGVRRAAWPPLGATGPCEQAASPSAGTQPQAPWEVLGPKGEVLARAEVVVIASGASLPKLALPGLVTDDPARAALAGRPAATTDLGLGWQTARGQLNWFVTGADTLRCPVTGQGYALGLPGGRLLCGATTHRDDPTPTPRAADTAFNLERLRSLTGIEPPADAEVSGRVGWRLVTGDRLPVVGAWPDVGRALEVRKDRVRCIPRCAGLFVAGGFGSRGLTWAPLAAEVLTGWIEGTPMPLEADLLDAIDPARGVVRAARRAPPG